MIPILTITEQQPGYYLVAGSLTFACINKQIVNALKLTNNQTLTVNLESVVATDSAGLALMIEWIRQSYLQKINIHFKNIPEQLIDLAKLTGLDKDTHFATHS